MRKSAFKRKPFTSRARVRQWDGDALPTPRAPVKARARATLAVEPIPKVEKLHHEGYRRLVASLPCMRCGVVGFSQAAHPNALSAGKAKGAKTDDRLCFPLCCDRPDVEGCHTRFDRHKMFDRWLEADMAKVWGEATRVALEMRWPARLPRWPG